jgi:hypothetical protein
LVLDVFDEARRHRRLLGALRERPNESGVSVG